MSKKDDALKKALENICAAKLCEFNSMSSRHEMIRLMDAAIAAIREALADQPAQQEPVAWMDGYRNIYSLEEKAAGCPEATIALVPMANHKKTSGSPINELQCVCGAVWLGDEMVHLPDKRRPASKPWVGLTDEERGQVYASWRFNGSNSSNLELCRAIEAKLKERNT